MNSLNPWKSPQGLQVLSILQVVVLIEQKVFLTFNITFAMHGSSDGVLRFDLSSVVVSCIKLQTNIMQDAHLISDQNLHKKDPVYEITGTFHTSTCPLNQFPQLHL